MKKNQLPQIGLPADACEQSGFTDKDTLELHAGQNALVFLKDKMTALEVANAIQSLSTLAADLTVVLASACGLCSNCGDECRDGCPAEWVAGCALCHDLLDESQSIRIPGYLLEESGIPADAKLEAYTDEDSGEITVVEADVQQDISDVPSGILMVLAQSGVCLAELDELIMQDSVIYGN